MTTPVSRREQIAELRTAHRRISRRHGYAKMLAAAVLVNIALAWTLMIAVGVLHSGWWRTVPTMGFGTAILVTGLLFFGVAVTVIISKEFIMTDYPHGYLDAFLDYPDEPDPVAAALAGKIRAAGFANVQADPGGSVEVIAYLSQEDAEGFLEYLQNRKEHGASGKDGK
jgi:hypothetical protein